MLKVLAVLVLGWCCSCGHVAPTVALAPTSLATDYFVLLYKGTHVAYGGGRGSERDLPECMESSSSEGGGSRYREACNLSHRRYWQRPLVERLCRCPGHTPCTLHSYEEQQPSEGSDVTTEGGGGVGGGVGTGSSFKQHLSNRAHLQFCAGEDTGRGGGGQSPQQDELTDCRSSEVSAGLRVQYWQRLDTGGGRAVQPQQSGGGRPHHKVLTDTRTTLHCHCPAPKQWQRVGTESQARREQGVLLNNTTHIYSCRELPQCGTGEPCSNIRTDTYESYYTCSCPPRHLCLMDTSRATTGGSSTHPTPGTLPHYDGPVYVGVCTSYTP